MNTKPTIGVVGFGIMGSAMAKNLAKQGFPVLGCSRSKDKVTSCATDGVTPAESIKELAAKASIILLAVTDGAAVESVLFGPDGAARVAAPGTLVIDTSTISPDDAVSIEKRCREQEVSYIDAPVSGGDTGARNGTLTVMVGGSDSDFRKATPVLEAIGSKIVHAGPIGYGQKTKAVNQLAVGLSVVAMTEALVFAEKCGLDLQTTLDTIQSGAAGSWSLSNYAPRVLKGDLAPGFAAAHMLKDLRIASQCAAQRGGESDGSLPGLKLVTELFERLVEATDGKVGNHGLIKLYR